MSYSFSQNQWGEKYIDELNRTDFASMKSAEFFDSTLNFELDKENTLFLIIGSDSGLLLSYLIKQKLGRGSRIAVIEHDDVYPLIAAEYRGLLSAGEAADSHSSIPISLHEHSRWQAEVFDGSDSPWLLGGQVKIVESNGSEKDYIHLYMPIVRTTRTAVDERLADLSASMNRAVFSRMQFRNCVDNINPLKSSISFGNQKTAVILGGGPSLDQHLEWVKSNRDKLFILAVSRLAPKLITHELKPDLLLSVDPFDFSYEICKQGILWTDVPLVCNFHVTSKLMQQWQGPCFYLGNRLPWHGKEQQEGYIGAAGPTVSHTATVVASRLGFTQILLTGVDLCYSLSASTHADDSPEQMIQQLPSLCDARVETYSGRIAGTIAGLKQGAKVLDDIGRMINKDEQAILYNLSEEAARCESIPYKDFKTVELPDSKPDLGTHVDLQPRIISAAELDELETELKRARHAFTKIRTLCAEAKVIVKRMHAPDAGTQAQKEAHKLSRLRKNLQNDFTQYLDAIIYFNALAFNKAKTPTDFTDMSSEELIKWGSDYYNLIDEAAENLIAYIDTVDSRITLRRDEHNVDIKVRELAGRWREDGTPGRILLWKQLNWQNVVAKDRAWVQRAIGKFRSTLNAPAASVKEELASKNSDINNVMKSLVFLGENKNVTELQSIQEKLSGKPWPYSALQHFTSGLVFHLQRDATAALTSFQNAVDICSEKLETSTESLSPMQRLIEECLVRMTQCCIELEDYESAMTTLSILSEMLPSYVISYAKMLNACGQTEFAVELLQAYIKLYPTHKKAHFSLRQIAPELAIEEDPVYVDKISHAMKAIMGGKPEQPA